MGGVVEQWKRSSRRSVRGLWLLAAVLWIQHNPVWSAVAISRTLGQDVEIVQVAEHVTENCGLIIAALMPGCSNLLITN